MLSPEARRALELWLEYTETRRLLMARLYQSRDNADAVQDLLDENDRRLDEALALTRQVLGLDKTG